MTTAPAAPAPPKPTKLPREQDPRNPVTRLTNLLDPGSLELITPDNLSGMVAARGTVAGATGHRVLLRRHRDGWCDG